jgi:hypothetical protein
VKRELDRDLPGPDFADADLNGFSGGALLGFNIQLADVVLGLEGEVALASLDKGDGSLMPVLPPNVAFEEGIDMTYAFCGRASAMRSTARFSS